MQAKRAARPETGFGGRRPLNSTNGAKLRPRRGVGGFEPGFRLRDRSGNPGAGRRRGGGVAAHSPAPTKEGTAPDSGKNFVAAALRNGPDKFRK